MLLVLCVILVVFIFFYAHDLIYLFFCIFFFKQKPAYEMRISDWSSDVCSSDLPPRYMKLVDFIPTADTDPALLDRLETFLVSGLGKGVVRARDTPNFIGNRIGVFGILSVFAQARKFGLTYELVDELTGSRLGRAKSGTFRTADVVGLDTMENVVRTLRDQLPDDPFHACFELPEVVQALIDKGALGQKTGAGFYRKQGKAILRLDPARP